MREQQVLWLLCCFYVVDGYDDDVDVDDDDDKDDKIQNVVTLKLDKPSTHNAKDVNAVISDHLPVSRYMIFLTLICITLQCC